MRRSPSLHPSRRGPHTRNAGKRECLGRLVVTLSEAGQRCRSAGSDGDSELSAGLPPQLLEVLLLFLDHAAGGDCVEFLNSGEARAARKGLTADVAKRVPEGFLDVLVVVLCATAYEAGDLSAGSLEDDLD